MTEVKVKFLDRVVVDNLYENAVDRFQARARRRNAIILVLILAIAGALIVWRLTA